MTKMQMTLQELRHSCEMTQKQIADGMEIRTQSQISRIEKQSDWRVGVVADYIESLGGKLVMIADFGDTEVEIIGLIPRRTKSQVNKKEKK